DEMSSRRISFEQPVRELAQLRLLRVRRLHTRDNCRKATSRDDNAAVVCKLFELAHRFQRDAFHVRKNDDAIPRGPEHQIILLDSTMLQQNLVIEKVEVVAGVEYRADGVRADTFAKNLDQVWIAFLEAGPAIVVW